MNPRELWERNIVLAEAFCASDERVRQAQSTLDDAQAERNRTLAAFAVTVGNDGSVADLMGLNEREVRVARRTVGREDARSVAKSLLQVCAAEGPQEPPLLSNSPVSTTSPVDATTEMEVHLPHPREEMNPQHPDPAPYDPASAHQAAPMTVPMVEENVVWSSSMDSVLLWSWQSGLDLQTVAGELGLDLRTLLLRVQTLAADGLLTSPSPSSVDNGQAGRHRRHYEEDPYTALFSPAPASFPSPVYR
ncbi:hypothetical protein [Streptomyces sp. SID3212]|uniref:hypothetical protein n=1 Tax=unclassified Streptomyces TaxID=2593676 RepID=UPI001370319C|nr:hypothetical protein [Streptomyces sp. SID3212]MYV54293.1 hypothetical protein [Streptomyces sp. SID3212]